MNRMGVVCMVGVLVGCNGGGFSQKEAETVAEANNAASTAAYSSLSDDMSARDTTSELEWVATDTGWTFAGSLSSDGPEWTGTMTFDGSMESSEDSASWQMDVVYDGVTVDGTTLDGEVSNSWAITWDDMGFTMTGSTSGELTASGEANGTGVIDVTSTVTVGASGASATVTGTVDGHEVDVDTAFAWSS